MKIIKLININNNNQLNINNCITSRVNELMKYGNFLFKIKNQRNVLKKVLDKKKIIKKDLVLMNNEFTILFLS